jgi:hypothetical protein
MMGIPLERWKFERQAQFLENELVGAFGRENVASVRDVAAECATVPPTLPLEHAGAASTGR